MDYAKLAPEGVILLAVISTVGYALARDWRQALYWFGVIIVTGAVTF